jgi:hypothetical protein
VWKEGRPLVLGRLRPVLLFARVWLLLGRVWLLFARVWLLLLGGMVSVVAAGAGLAAVVNTLARSPLVVVVALGGVRGVLFLGLRLN